MKERLIDLLLTKEVLGGLIDSSVAIAAALIGVLVQSRIERKRRNEVLFIEDRKKVYSKVLGCFRLGKKITDENLNEAVNEAILLSTGDLRDKLIKAIKSTPDDWMNAYGMEAAAALKDLETEMKKVLGIEFKNSKWNTLRNWIKETSFKRELKIQKDWPFITYWGR